ncbi:hypothetical protein X757_03220 [Mesorhizobium sp. LSHC414A00]|nr:hypothetical protein X757_03220 [Mesorhizobium sp. LSHC414A00]
MAREDAPFDLLAATHAIQALADCRSCILQSNVRIDVSKSIISTCKGHHAVKNARRTPGLGRDLGKPSPLVVGHSFSLQGCASTPECIGFQKQRQLANQIGRLVGDMEEAENTIGLSQNTTP